MGYLDMLLRFKCINIGAKAFVTVFIKKVKVF